MNLRELNLDPTLESHLVYEMSVQQVQDSNEEFVGILLLVSCQQIIYFLHISYTQKKNRQKEYSK